MLQELSQKYSRKGSQCSKKYNNGLSETLLKLTKFFNVAANVKKVSLRLA